MKELADAAEMMPALLSAARRRRLHIKAVRQSVREATTASGVDNAAVLDWQTPAEFWDYFTLREKYLLQKQLEGTQKYINELGADRVAYIDGQLMQLL